MSKLALAQTIAVHAHRLFGYSLVCAVLIGTPFLVSAQEEPVHLNPVIAKLEAGETVYGLSTQDLSIAYARQVARAPADFLYVDMEHGPMDFPALGTFLLAMGDKEAMLSKGSAQPNVALFARFAPRPEDSQWVVKQALDLGLYGVIFNGVDTPEQAEFAVSTMRYPQLRDSSYPEPAGIRGWSPANAAWAWGVSPEQYLRHADLWPLNPDGDLLAIMMIESAEALTNVDAIAATPGVGALFPGAGGDLSRSLGVPRGSPELEQAFDQILAACRRRGVACAISAATGEDVSRRVRDGWQIIRTTVAGANAGRALLEPR
ncbi:MAG: aldolase/citrate lyase family protein [Gammaproteobacteria bacterium]|jgi:4-hydroxy-2-oxoheptanedioate aldolase